MQDIERRAARFRIFIVKCAPDRLIKMKVRANSLLTVHTCLEENRMKEPTMNTACPKCGSAVLVGGFRFAGRRGKLSVSHNLAITTIVVIIETANATTLKNHSFS